MFRVFCVHLISKYSIEAVAIHYSQPIPNPDPDGGRMAWISESNPNDLEVS